jgi:hypothetical protein
MSRVRASGINGSSPPAAGPLHLFRVASLTLALDPRPCYAVVAGPPWRIRSGQKNMQQMLLFRADTTDKPQTNGSLCERVLRLGPDVPSTREHLSALLEEGSV